MNYTVTVFGLGFVGLTTALAFAEKNHKVYGIDIDTNRADMIKRGQLPFLEPGLDQALVRHINDRFTVTDDVVNAVRESDFIFLCVGTPCGEGGEADLTFVYSAIDSFTSTLDDGKYRIVVIKSTIPPSTTSERIIPYLEEKGFVIGKDIGVANNPEFLREGYCWDDMIHADRIVCGVSDSKSKSMLKLLYSGFDAPLFAVSLNTGEFIKYLSNTLLATMISYSNDMSKIADVIGNIEIADAFRILHLDKRWGGSNMASYVYPGCGYGGYCLPKDTQAMYANALSKGYDSLMLKNVIDMNNSMPGFMASKIMRKANKTDKIAVLGLSFKPGSDDVRDSSSAKIIEILLQEGYNNIHAYDPIATHVFDKEYNFDKVTYWDNLKSLCTQADMLVLATAWEQFSDIDKEHPDKVIIDCRYFLGRDNLCHF